MNNNNLNLLSDRVEKLETRLGWWQLISFAALTCLVIFVSLHNVKVRNLTCNSKLPKVPPSLIGRFSEITIVDSEGRSRTILSVNPTGPQLSFMNEDATTGCTLSLDNTYGASLVFRKNEKTRVSITSIPSAIICADSEGSPRAILAVSKKADGVFSLTRSDGEPIVYQRQVDKPSQLPSSE